MHRTQLQLLTSLALALALTSSTPSAGSFGPTPPTATATPLPEGPPELAPTTSYEIPILGAALARLETRRGQIASRDRREPRLPMPAVVRYPSQARVRVAAGFLKGTHSMCAVAIDYDTNMTNLGCRDFAIQ